MEEFDVSPEPDPVEREALAAALRSAVPRPADPRSGWWREGVLENVLDGSAEALDETR